MAFAADPGGNFASNAHRRVMAVLGNDDEPSRKPFDLVLETVDADDQIDLDAEEVIEILKDLQADGDADHTDEGYDATEIGLEALTGPPADSGGRTHG